MKITKMIKKNPKPTVEKYACPQTNRSFKIPPQEIQYKTLLSLILEKKKKNGYIYNPAPPPPPAHSLTMSSSHAATFLLIKIALI